MFYNHEERKDNKKDNKLHVNHILMASQGSKKLGLRL